MTIKIVKLVTKAINFIKPYYRIVPLMSVNFIHKFIFIGLFFNCSMTIHLIILRFLVKKIIYLFLINLFVFENYPSQILTIPPNFRVFKPTILTSKFLIKTFIFIILFFQAQLIIIFNFLQTKLFISLEIKFGSAI